jgi:hypothetical protein
MCGQYSFTNFSKFLIIVLRVEIATTSLPEASYDSGLIHYLC